MLKLVFWCLLAVNAALFAYHQGYLGTLVSDGREAGRAAKQFNADKVRLIPAATTASVAGIAPALAAEKKPDVVACTEIGNFDAAEARRFAVRLAALSLGDRLSRRAVRDVARHMVFIPSQGSKEAADRKAGELRQLGVKDFYVIQEDSDLHWGISLGIFKTEETARTHLAALTQQGVRSARLGQYNAASNKVAFQLHDLDASASSNLDKIKADFPHHETRDCETP
jgi:hypothetical protein